AVAHRTAHVLHRLAAPAVGGAVQGLLDDAVGIDAAPVSRHRPRRRLLCRHVKIREPEAALRMIPIAIRDFAGAIERLPQHRAVHGLADHAEADRRVEAEFIRREVCHPLGSLIDADFELRGGRTLRRLTTNTWIELYWPLWSVAAKRGSQSGGALWCRF